VPDDASLFRRLHDAVEAETGLPILLQTSFNRREPLVEMPADAIATARLMGLDALCLDGFWIERLSHCSP
jgi:carbamoyltransferase